MHPAAALLWAALAASSASAQDSGRIQLLISQLGDSRTSEPAAQALVQIGEPAVRALRSTLASDAPTPTVTAALITLGRMRGVATAAVPDLLVVLRQGPDRTNALWALGEIGPHSPRRLRLPDQILSALGLSTSFFSSELHRTLSRLTVDPTSSLEGLEAELDNGNPHVWEYIAEILGQRGGSEAIPVLLRILETRQLPRSRSYSYTVAGGEPFRMTFPSTRTTPRVQGTAAHALVRIAPERPEAIPAYLILLESNDAEDRRDAAMALGRQGARAAEAVTPLRRATLDKDLRIVREAVTALGMIGTASAPAVPALQRMLDHEDPQVSQRARVALRQIRGDGD